MKIYRIVDEQGNVVSGINKDTDIYTSIGGAKSAKTQLAYFLTPRILTIEEAEIGDWTGTGTD